MTQSSKNDETSGSIVRRREMVASAAAGAMGGAMAKTTIAPLERTKIYFQTHPKKNYRIKGAVKFLRKTYTQDGFFSLWRGNSATMLRVIPYASIQFVAHEHYKRLLRIDSSYSGQTNHKLQFLAGSAAGITGQALTYPLDRARAVMAVTKVGEYRNLYHVYQTIITREGLLGLYRGYVPTLIGIIPYAGTSFSTYDRLKRYWTQKAKEKGRDGPTNVERLMSGGVAGLLGQASSYPLDIVRRRMQTASQMGLDPKMYPTIRGTLVTIFRKEGIRKGWFKGLSMNFIKGPISVGICFMTYDHFKDVWLNLLLPKDGHC